MVSFKTLITLSFLCILLSNCSFVDNVIMPEYTDEQCKAVTKNFGKLKIGMSEDEILPLIGGERNKIIYRNAGYFPEQKSQWKIIPLCYDFKSCVVTDSKQRCYQWFMIAIDPTSNTVVKIFSEDPELIGFF